jgi:hypothetical protein
LPYQESTYLAERESERKKFKEERLREQRLQSERLREQTSMKKQIDELQPSNQIKQENMFTKSVLEANSISDYQSYVHSKLKSRQQQKDLSRTYQEAITLRAQESTRSIATTSPIKAKESNTQRATELQARRIGSIFKSTRNSGYLHTTVDIDPNRGILAHFFRRDQDSNAENPGRQYLNRALDKQKQFDKIFLQHIMAGEKEKIQRTYGGVSLRGGRSSSVKTPSAAENN